MGGLLTIDHFRPQSRGGADDLDNLVYACASCNQYKQGYWSDDASASRLWNPRVDEATDHFIELEDGQLAGITSVGEFTIRRLRLNRHPLVAYRLNRKQLSQDKQLSERYQSLVQLLSEANQHLSELVLEQQQLLQAQRDLLNVLLRQRDAVG